MKLNQIKAKIATLLGLPTMNAKTFRKVYPEFKNRPLKKKVDWLYALGHATKDEFGTNIEEVINYCKKYVPASVILTQLNENILRVSYLGKTKSFAKPNYTYDIDMVQAVQQFVRDVQFENDSNEAAIAHKELVTQGKLNR